LLIYVEDKKKKPITSVKDIQKELERKYGYSSKQDDDFDEYTNQKLNSIKREFLKENKKPKASNPAPSQFEAGVFLLSKKFIIRVQETKSIMT
jgi:hypothetical protein